MSPPDRQPVLWVSEEPPDRGLGGGNIRQAHLFEAVARAHPTDLLVIGSVGDARVRAAADGIAELPQRRVWRTGHPLARRVLELGISLGSPNPLPLFAARLARRDLGREIARASTPYELVCVEHEALAPLWAPRQGEPWLLTFHNLLSGMAREELALAPGLRQRWFRSREVVKAERLEARALGRFARCVVCSEEDADELERIGGSGGYPRPIVVPNGVDLELFGPSPPPAEPRVLLPGTLAWGPNVDGARWFCDNIWPHVREAVPEATLELAGRAPGPQILRLGARPGVSVHANVPSMVSHFQAARAVVVPLRIGTGTRVKALEAMAAARPVVGTSIGLAGIGAEPGTHALVADDAPGLTAALIEVLRNDELAGSLGRAGRGLVERRFGWDRIGARYVEAVSELLAERQAPERSSSSSA
jgi:glycosyltransferase involved in cell wall biosynthesis